jgi:hypothetical protein
MALADSGSPQFSLRPVTYNPNNPTTASYFIFNPQLGATVQSQVRVTNTGTVRGSVALYPVDATTGQSSGVVYLSHQDPRKDTGAWMTIGTSQLTLNPSQSQVVSFSVAVPKDASPGQHVGGIVAENLAIQQGTSGGGVQINIQHLSVIAVQLNLPGAQIEKLEAQRIKAGGEHSYQVLAVSLRNTGTQMLKPNGTLQVQDKNGHELKNIAMKLDTFLPQTAIDYPAYVEGQALGPGHYKAKLTLHYGTGKVLSFTTDFEITAQDLQQTFGDRPPNTLPPTSGNGGSGPSPLEVAAGVLGLVVLGGVGALVFVPKLRTRIPMLKR